MAQLRFWQKKLEAAWQRRSVLWLSGVRRAGKTFLCQSLPRIEYFECYVVAQDVTHGYERKFADLTVRFVGLPMLIERVLAR